MKKVSNKKTIRRFNVFDIIVILLVVVLIASFVYRIYVGVDKTSGQSRSKYAISFECDSEYNSLLKYVKEGDAIYFEHDGVLLGYVYAKDDSENGAIYEIIDNTANGSGSTGGAEPNDAVVEYEKVRIGGFIKLNVDAVKSKNGNHYTIGDTNISNGSVISVYTEKTTFTLTVKDIFMLE